jgi:hypothetical protein
MADVKMLQPRAHPPAPAREENNDIKAFEPLGIAPA